MFVSALGAAARGLFATLFPASCRLCQTPLERVSALPVCQGCLDRMRPIDGIICALCGERLLSPHIANEPEPRCGLCQRVQPVFTKAAAYAGYDGGLRELIHLLKYERVRPAAAVLGRMLAEVVEGMAPTFTSPPLAVPVPLHATKLRQRGFNQSELIARAALKRCGGDIALNITGLERRRPTESQTGLTRHQRRENIRGAFAVVRPNEICGRDILLMDDVFTTGTTVSECARVLLRAGASRIWVATVARVLKSESSFALEEEEREAAPRAAAGGA